MTERPYTQQVVEALVQAVEGLEDQQAMPDDFYVHALEQGREWLRRQRNLSRALHQEEWEDEVARGEHRD